ncbi:MAG: hypothetical protein ABI181_14780 [Mycobacteriaceae bacterium]
MSHLTAHPATRTHPWSQLWTRARQDPAYGAFWLLRVGFVLLPLLMGADKFANKLTYWPGYLAPWTVDLLPFSTQTAMYVVGVVEIIAAIAVAFRPRYAAYVVALWLTGIVVNLLTYSGFYDVALRDVGLLVAALALARLSATYDRGGVRTGAADDVSLAR